MREPTTTESRTNSRPTVSLVPREHGAWAQLCLPLATALLAFPVHGAGALLAVAAVAGFLAQEPARVLLGHRGRRARQHGREAARARLAGMGTLAVVAGVAGLVWLPDDAARLTVLVPAALAVAAGALVLAHREKTAVGELVAAITLTSCALPVAAAGGGVGPAAMIVGGFAALFVLATLAVRTVIAHRRRPVPLAARGVIAVFAVVAPLAPAVAAASGLDSLSVALAIGLVPACLVVAALAIRPPHPRLLRPVGWTMAAATTLAAVTLIIGARLAGA